jgi:hypothetical protein
VDARLHEAMDLGEALTFETRRGAEELERTVRDINRLEAMPATPVRLQLPSAAGAAAAPPALRDAAPLPSLRREEGSPPQPQPLPEAWSLPPAGEGGEAARAAMRARLDAAPRVEHMCPGLPAFCSASPLVAPPHVASLGSRRLCPERLCRRVSNGPALGLQVARRACTRARRALLRGPGPLLPLSLGLWHSWPWRWVVVHPPLSPPSQARVGDIMRRVLPHPEAAAAAEPPPRPAPRPGPEPTPADGATAQPGTSDSRVGGTSAGRTGYKASWMVRGALWFYLAVLALSLVIGGGICMVRLLQMLAAALRRRHGSLEPPLHTPYASDRLSDGMDAAAAQAAWQRRIAAAKSGAGASEAPPPLPGPDSRVQDLLRSGKQNFSVSESRAVANFLARKAKQDDLLILCGKG